MQIQIFTSLTLILGAVLVALICDYLKCYNERLRELMVELKVRREESEKMINLLRSMESPVQARPEPAQKEFSPGTQTSAPEPERALSRAEAPAGREGSQRAVSNMAERKRISSDALAAIVRRARKAGAQVTPQPESQPVAEPTAPDGSSDQTAEPVASAEVLQQVVDAAVAPREAAASAKASIGLKQENSRKKDWNSLLATRPTAARRPEPAPNPHSVEVSKGLLDQIVAASSKPKTASLPAGVHTAAALKQLTAGGLHVSGLVVSIAGTSPSHAETDPDFPAAVLAEIRSLIEPGEFAAPAGPNEYILIAPAARGAAAQRRLGRITQHLWDVQLASLGRFELQFTWGGLEVRDEPIEEAIESATERMLETRHSRNLVTLAAGPQPMRKAV